MYAKKMCVWVCLPVCIVCVSDVCSCVLFVWISQCVPESISVSVCLSVCLSTFKLGRGFEALRLSMGWLKSEKIFTP